VGSALLSVLVLSMLEVGSAVLVDSTDDVDSILEELSEIVGPTLEELSVLVGSMLEELSVLVGSTLDVEETDEQSTPGAVT